MQKVIVLRGALAAALAVFILTSASGEARRVHDPDKATKIRTERTTNAPESNDFRARIDALMKNANEINAPVREDDSPFSVPKTLSASDPAISVSPRELVAYYYEEGAREGIRPDVAFAQALKETGFFRYGGTVTPDQNNYCGLGTTSTEIKGAYFATSQIGVRAHIQHLLAYASTRRPVRPVVDPRYNLVRNVYGTITLGNWQDLNGRWAVPGDSYGQSILSMFRAILRK